MIIKKKQETNMSVFLFLGVLCGLISVLLQSLQPIIIKSTTILYRCCICLFIVAFKWVYFK